MQGGSTCTWKHYKYMEAVDVHGSDIYIYIWNHYMYECVHGSSVSII